MGTRYFLTVVCPNCGQNNEDVYFAPTCDMVSSRCQECKEIFYIGDDMQGHKSPQPIDMRKHSMWGDDYEEKVG